MGGPPLDRSEVGPHRAGARGRGRRRVVLAALAALCCATPGAHAATDAEAQAAATAVTQASAVPAGWTGLTSTCDPGTETQASLDATLQAVNAFRAVAGLTPVALDAALSTKALAAALMMRAGNDVSPPRGLSHTPDPSWPCYSLLGADGAGTSNLALGSSGAGAVRLYVDDDGVSSLGHRRWVLDPGLTVIGTGSTGSTNALTVIGGARQPVSPGRQVPWPPAGAIAYSWLPSTWSISIGGTGEAVSFTAPAVSMTLDGAPIQVSGVSDLGTGYGTGRSLSWVPALGNRQALRTGSHELGVSISGVSIGSVATPVAYTVTLGPPAPTPTPSPAPAPAPTPTPPAQPRSLPNLSPRILRPRGKLRVGTRLTATFAQNTGRITTKMQWLRSGRPIKGATAIHHRISRKDLGRTLRIVVTSQAKDGTGVVTERSAGVKIRR
jgi:uncharacterized protein YkwD